MADEEDDNVDMWATAQESTAYTVDLYRRVWAFADETIADRDLDAVGAVSWWPAERRTVTLAQVIVHVTADLDRHGGHADILRELTDGAVGMRPERSNIPELTGAQWEAHVERLKTVADQAAGRTSPGRGGND